MRLLQSLCLFLLFAILSPTLPVMASQAGGRISASQETPPDPAGLGSYGVGVTTRTFANTSPGTSQANSLETVIWYPANATAMSSTPDPTLGAVVNAEPDRAAAPYPVFVWSHGQEGPLVGTTPRGNGEPWGSSYLATHLAGHGFIVVAPRHPDTFSSDRPAEVIFALDQALTASAGTEDAQLAGLLDRTRVGVEIGRAHV